MESNQIQQFEDKRWSSHEQQIVWRHQAGLELVSAEPVLDVGGGDGLFLRLLQERGYSELHLLDVSPVAVDNAQKKGLSATTGDVTKPFPFPDDAFGTVCALDVLEHLYDPVFALREMDRVGQEVVVVVPNFHYWKYRVQMMCGRVPFQCKPKRGHVYWFNYPVLQEVVRETGLEVESILLSGFTRLGPIGPWLAARYPNLFGGAFAIKARTSAPRRSS